MKISIFIVSVIAAAIIIAWSVVAVDAVCRRVKARRYWRRAGGAV